MASGRRGAVSAQVSVSGVSEGESIQNPVYATPCGPSYRQDRRTFQQVNMNEGVVASVGVCIGAIGLGKTQTLT
jgi:hypothetical protein